MMCPYPRVTLHIYVNAILFSSLALSHFSDVRKIETTTLDYSQASAYGYTCTFDYSMCGWTQYEHDAINWTRWTGSTPSRSTGPLSDHTGSGRYYLYIESSGKAVNDNAMIIGPSFYIKPFNLYCFSFWYNMYGITIGTLNVYVKHSNRNFQRIWARRGDQGQAWTYAEVTVNDLGYIQIAIEGVVGQGFTGDIAVDDTHLKSGACKGSPTTLDRTTKIFFPITSKKPLTRWTNTGPETLAGYNCTFDQSICGWHQSTADVFDWTRHAGETQSIYTGPLMDHTTKSRVGKYMYIEASSPRLTGDNAKLSGPFFNNGMNGTYCFSFWYNMFDGGHGGMGTLQILVRDERYTFLKWKKTGNQWRDWLKAEVTISASSNKMQIVIEGIRGSSYAGDIAIDDTLLTAGTCENTITTKTTETTQVFVTTRKYNQRFSEPSGHVDTTLIIFVTIIISSGFLFCVLCIVSIRKLRKNSSNTDGNSDILRRRNDQPFTISDSQMEAIAFHNRSSDTALHNYIANTSTDTRRTENQYEPPDYESLYRANDGQETETHRFNGTRHRVQPFTLPSAIDEQGDTYTSPVRSNPHISPTVSPDTMEDTTEDTTEDETENATENATEDITEDATEDTIEDTPPPNYWSLQETYFWQCNVTDQADDIEPPPYPGNSENHT